MFYTVMCPPAMENLPDCFIPAACLPLCLLQVVEDDSGVLEVVMAAAEVETVSHQLVAGIGR